MFNINKDALVKKVIYPPSDLRYYANQKWLKHNYDENIPKHILKHMKYYRIAIAAVKENVLALAYLNQAWALKNSGQHYEVALEAVKQNGYALEYVNPAWVLANPQQYYEIALAAVNKDRYALLYVYMLNNKNVSNNFKNALFDFFIKKCQHALADKFTLYKNIFECYLTLSNGYKNAFPHHKLLENLRDDDS